MGVVLCGLDDKAIEKWQNNLKTGRCLVKLI